MDLVLIRLVDMDLSTGGGGGGVSLILTAGIQDLHVDVVLIILYTNIVSRLCVLFFTFLTEHSEISTVDNILHTPDENRSGVQTLLPH